MATALETTVSQYIPTFQKVEYNHNKPLPNPPSPDGAGAEEGYLGNSLVLSDTASITSTKSDKMKKKMDYEADKKPKTNRRILRTLSKTFRPSTSSTSTTTAANIKISSPKPQRALSRSISIHEMNKSNEIKKSGALSRLESRRLSEMRSSGGLKKSASLKSSSSLKSSAALQYSKALPVAPARKSSLANIKSPQLSHKNLAELKKSVDIKKQSAELKRSASGDLRRSGAAVPRRGLPIPPSQLREPIVVPATKSDAINTLLADFEAQKRRAFELAQLEHDIYKQEVAKYEEMLQRKKQEAESAIALANSIRDRESQLQTLLIELHQKEKSYHVSEEELTAFNKEFEEELQKREAAIAEHTGETSAAMRLKDASNRRALREAWKAETNPANEARSRMATAQEDIQETRSRIKALTTELGRLKGQAQKGKSSDQRLLAERTIRDELRKTGQTRPQVYTRPKGVPRSNEVRAHMSRLEEEKVKRAAARRKQQPQVSDLIAQQAGVSRGRYGSPYRQGMLGRSSTMGRSSTPTRSATPTR